MLILMIQPFLITTIKEEALLDGLMGFGGVFFPMRISHLTFGCSSESRKSITSFPSYLTAFAYIHSHRPKDSSSSSSLHPSRFSGDLRRLWSSMGPVTQQLLIFFTHFFMLNVPKYLIQTMVTAKSSSDPGLTQMVPLVDGRIRYVLYAFYFYHGLSTWYGLMTLPSLLLGHPSPPLFNLPFLTTSPRDFWSRRWNLLFHGAMIEALWRPLANGLGIVGKNTFPKPPMQGLRLWLAGFATFIYSAFFHEYLCLCLFGYTYWENARFFLIHGAITLTQWTIEALFPRIRLGGWIGWAFTVTSFALSAHLFFAPFERYGITQLMTPFALV